MSDTKDVQIERTFDAPIDLIWAMWTEAEHFANCMAPWAPPSRRPRWTSG